MTQGVVTAESGDSLQHVGELMRDRNVGSVVICDEVSCAWRETTRGSIS